MDHHSNRRDLLKCLGIGTGTLFAMSGGVLSGFDLAEAATLGAGADIGAPLFAQISDTHIGFTQPANPDVAATLTRSIDLVNALPRQPAFVLHTGDVTQLSKASEFDDAAQLMTRFKPSEIHVVPGEHDMFDHGVGFFARYGAPSKGKGWYSFDHAGVHFVALNNVQSFKAETFGALGDEQLAWLKDDLAGRSSSQPIVLFAHMPMWTIYAPWGWGTSDADQVLALTRRFAAITVLNGHIHQIVSRVEGNVTFHTARSTAFPQPAPGAAASAGPLKVPDDQLASMLGVTTVSRAGLHKPLVVTDTALG